MALVILMSASVPALAKVTTVCKQHVLVSSGYSPSEAQAQADAEKKWILAVTTKYGHSWASLEEAKNKHLNCKQSKSGQWICSLSAQACAQVKAPTPSMVGPVVPRAGLFPSRKSRSASRLRFAPSVAPWNFRSRSRPAIPGSVSRLR